MVNIEQIIALAEAVEEHRRNKIYYVHSLSIESAKLVLAAIGPFRKILDIPYTDSYTCAIDSIDDVIDGTTDERSVKYLQSAREHLIVALADAIVEVPAIPAFRATAGEIPIPLDFPARNDAHHTSMHEAL